MKKIQENRRRRCDDVSSINSIAFRLFGIPVYWYAIIIVSGIALAVWLSSREAVRVGLKEDVFDFMLWGLPAAIVGARLYYVAFQWQDYVTIRLKFSLPKWWLSDLWWSYWWGLALFFFTRHRFISTWTF